MISKRLASRRFFNCLLAVSLIAHSTPSRAPGSPSAANKAQYLELQEHYGRSDGRHSLPDGARPLARWPYLQSVTASGAVVRWGTRDPDAGSTIRWWRVGEVPHRRPGYELCDELSRQAELRQERCLLYVAATRARDQLLITGYGRRSPLLGAKQ